jgi:hypothetical protein
MTSSETSEPSESKVPSTILPPDLVGEIAKWYVPHINDHVKNYLMYEAYSQTIGIVRMTVRKKEIPHLNKLLWCYKIMCMYSNLPEDQDIIDIRSLPKYFIYIGDPMIEIHIYNDTQVYKYFLKHSMMSRSLYGNRGAVMVYLILEDRDDLFFEYLSLFPWPFTAKELKIYMGANRFLIINTGKPFKYIDYIEQKLKEIID